MTTPVPEGFNEACEDAVRDAAALIRAKLAGDYDAADVVTENLSWPYLTLRILAGWCAEWMQAAGASQAVLDDWQQSAGLM